MSDSIHMELAEAVQTATSALRKAIAAAYAGGLRIDVTVDEIAHHDRDDRLPVVHSSTYSRLT